MKSVNPYLIFSGNAEEAFTFYASVFGREILDIVRFKDFGEPSEKFSEEELNNVAHIALPLGKDDILMASDTVSSMAPEVIAGNNFYITVAADDSEEATRLFDALSAGGKVQMPLGKTAWAEKYGMCTDQFGIQWMVSYAGDVQFFGAAKDD